MPLNPQAHYFAFKLISRYTNIYINRYEYIHTYIHIYYSFIFLLLRGKFYCCGFFAFGRKIIINCLPDKMHIEYTFKKKYILYEQTATGSNNN